MRGLVAAARANDGEQDRPVTAAGLLPVAALTIANGADNLSIYIPLFRTIGVGDSLLTAAIFAVMVAVWVTIGLWLSSHKRVVDLVGRFGHWLVPVVFVAVGILILMRSGVITHAFAAL